MKIDSRIVYLGRNISALIVVIESDFSKYYFTEIDMTEYLSRNFRGFSYLRNFTLELLLVP